MKHRVNITALCSLEQDFLKKFEKIKNNKFDLALVDWRFDDTNTTGAKYLNALQNTDYKCILTSYAYIGCEQSKDIFDYCEEKNIGIIEKPISSTILDAFLDLGRGNVCEDTKQNES